VNHCYEGDLSIREGHALLARTREFGGKNACRKKALGTGGEGREIPIPDDRLRRNVEIKVKNQQGNTKYMVSEININSSIKGPFRGQGKRSGKRGDSRKDKDRLGHSEGIRTLTGGRWRKNGPFKSLETYPVDRGEKKSHPYHTSGRRSALSLVYFRNERARKGGSGNLIEV